MTARQLSLLNEPRSRAKDPATSKLAAQAVTPAVGELERLIVNFVAVAVEAATAERIAYALDCMLPNRWDEGTIRTAVSRAAKRGLIEPCGTGLTSRGRSAVTYRRVR